MFKQTCLTQISEAKRPGRISLGPSIQVKATPTNHRFKNALDSAIDPSAGVAVIPADEMIPPSSIGAVVPSTAERRGYRDFLASCTSPADIAVSTPVQLPSGRNFLRCSLKDAATIPASSPLVEMTDTNFLVPGSAHRPTENPDYFSRSLSSYETPIKKSFVKNSSNVAFHNDVPVQKEEKQTSIYEKLGWNDDFDELY